MSVLSLDDLVKTYRLRPMEERILRAIWGGNGHPVATERIFDAMYADDPDGGPSPSKMYREFRATVGRLLARIEGSGVAIGNAGRLWGFRLVIKGSENAPRS